MKKVVLLICLIFLWFPQFVFSQLISPGKLLNGHATLEGISNCTSCHELGKKGIDKTKCLSCHTPIQESIDSKFGLHSTKEILDKNCASCHKDHFGRDFDAIRFDTTKFDHEKTTFKLLGKHIDANCADCHKSEFITKSSVKEFAEKHNRSSHTYLGLDTNCVSCHNSDNPHKDQFINVRCSDCHQEKEWKDVSKFEHEKSNFALLGKHIDVKCESCHKPFPNEEQEIIQYKGIDFATCESCHEDKHEGRLDKTCATCHNETSFHVFADFPEKTYLHKETGYELIGSHSLAKCVSCHQQKANDDRELYAIKIDSKTKNFTYPHPIASECTSCHKDIHKEIFKNKAGLTLCTDCHNQTKWLPSSYSIEKHNSTARFVLTGSHIATPCFACHSTGNEKHDFPKFRMENNKACESCHQVDNPHKDEFVNEVGVTVCATCHNTENWKKAAYDHDKTGFPLLGKHLGITCESCHVQDKTQKTKVFKLASSECSSCHEKDSPHQKQFDESVIGTSCNLCHDNESFKIASFDHSKTRFILDGQHINAACSDCHKVEKTSAGVEFTRFVPVSSKCVSCHG